MGLSKSVIVAQNQSWNNKRFKVNTADNSVRNNIIQQTSFKQTDSKQTKRSYLYINDLSNHEYIFKVKSKGKRQAKLKVRKI